MDGLYIMENLIKMDDLGIPPFSETPIYYVFFPQPSCPAILI